MQFQIYKGRVLLVCPNCGDENSATKGDYWDVADNIKFDCGNCENPMILAEKCEVYKVIKQNATVGDLAAL